MTPAADAKSVIWYPEEQEAGTLEEEHKAEGKSMILLEEEQMTQQARDQAGEGGGESQATAIREHELQDAYLAAQRMLPADAASSKEAPGGANWEPEE